MANFTRMHRRCCIFYLTLVVAAVAFPGIAGDRSQADCQDNEVFIECSHCEATCKEPFLPDCPTHCRGPPRCECIMANGFVRTHDGACIHVSECGSYRGIETFGNGDPHVSGESFAPAQTIGRPQRVHPMAASQPAPPTPMPDYDAEHNSVMEPAPPAIRPPSPPPHSHYGQPQHYQGYESAYMQPSANSAQQYRFRHRLFARMFRRRF